MVPAQYNTALALYFVAYVIFEIPANVSLSSSLSICIIEVEWL